MAITRYTMSFVMALLAMEATTTPQLEFATAEDRDAAYTKAKTWATNEKTGGKVSAGTLTKGEFVRPENSSEAI